MNLTHEHQMIHADSLRAAKAFADAYREDRESDETKRYLELYVSLRRQLPRDESGNHVGYREAQTVIQGN